MEIGKGGRPPGLPKTGGRKKGTPNKATLTIAEKLEALGWDPLEGLAGIAMDLKNPPELRARCHWEALPYLYPKRRPIDSSVERSTSMNMITNLDSAPEGHDVGNQPSSKP
jgi:hypothetical protein